MVVKLIVMERLFQSIKVNGFKLQLSTIVIKLLSIVVLKQRKAENRYGNSYNYNNKIYKESNKK